ncbi:DUF1146 family protein [Amedibacillus sp. YH-ame10]
MQYYLIRLSVHVICFMLSFWALSSVRFDKFCDVKKPGKVQMLLLLLSLGLGYVCAQFLLSITYYM